MVHILYTLHSKETCVHIWTELSTHISFIPEVGPISVQWFDLTRSNIVCWSAVMRCVQRNPSCRVSRETADIPLSVYYRAQVPYMRSNGCGVCCWLVTFKELIKCWRPGWLQHVKYMFDENLKMMWISWKLREDCWMEFVRCCRFFFWISHDLQTILALCHLSCHPFKIWIHITI